MKAHKISASKDATATELQTPPLSTASNCCSYHHNNIKHLQTSRLFYICGKHCCWPVQQTTGKCRVHWKQLQCWRLLCAAALPLSRQKSVTARLKCTQPIISYTSFKWVRSLYLFVKNSVICIMLCLCVVQSRLQFSDINTVKYEAAGFVLECDLQSDSSYTWWQSIKIDEQTNK